MPIERTNELVTHTRLRAAVTVFFGFSFERKRQNPTYSTNTSAPGAVLTWPLPFLKGRYRCVQGSGNQGVSAGAGVLGEGWTQLGSAWRSWSRKARLGSYRKLGASLIEREASDAAMAWGIQYSRWNEEGLLRGKEEEGRPQRAKRGWQRALLLFANQWGAFAGSEMSVGCP